MSNAALDWAFRMPIAGAAKAVLVALADHANDRGDCFPSIARLELWTGLKDRAIRNAIAWLEARNLIRRTTKIGSVTEYKLHVEVEYTPARDAEVAASNPHQTPASNAATPASGANPPRHLVPKTPASGAARTLKNPKEEPLRTQRAHAREVAPPDGFAAFWSAYPRKVGKGQAERAYRTAIRGTDPDAILAALVAYPFDLGRPQFIPHASTWLNGKRWLDQIDTRDPVLAAVGFYDRDTGVDCQLAHKGFLQ